jgi:hypothetical protein
LIFILTSMLVVPVRHNAADHLPRCVSTSWLCVLNGPLGGELRDDFEKASSAGWGW